MDLIKMRLDNRYNGGLFMIAAAVVLTLGSQLCGLLKLWFYLPFPVPFLSLWFPYTFVMTAQTAMFGVGKYIAIVCLCAAPAFFLMYFRAGAKAGNYRWLIAAFAMICADALYVVYDLIAKVSRYSGLPMCLVVHFVMLLIIFDAIRAGRTIEKGIKQPKPSTIEEEAAIEEQATSAEEQTGGITCRYDAGFARKHHARKLFLIPVVFVVFFAVMFLGLIFCMGHLDMTLGIDSGTAVLIFLIILAADIVCLLLSALKLSVFWEAGRTTYTIKPYGQIIRHKSFEPAPFDIVTYNKPVLCKEKRDRWIIRYQNSKGRKRKAVIPKAFPRMADYFAQEQNNTDL